ncbi:DEAD/DEAH box helicase domain-containing protein [Besnoitia besnoiti]|uniref:DEAD/DEAH box helicase domain-containing protein n=1 Tax=Besnoitia besnoiti TaxID=94643 RepID=A0A2A9M820_BESBE|nr:DEAD/DEAH box helicase domain-containing protein [Besnoitia besnoiti]PFH31823.1 DEAD/DEAH box helicase domain-containing protein [Besnoitia besnoiti]
MLNGLPWHWHTARVPIWLPCRTSAVGGRSRVPLSPVGALLSVLFSPTFSLVITAHAGPARRGDLRGISEIRSKALEELANLRSCFDLLLFLPCQYVALQTPAALPPEPSRTCDAGASESRTPEWTKSYAGPLAHRLAADGVDVHGAVEAETEPGAPRGREAPGARSVLPREEGAVDLMAGDNRAAWIHMSDAQPHKGRTADSSSKFQFSFVRAVPRQPSTEKASDTHPVKESRVGGVSSTPVAAASSSNAEPNTPSLRGGVAGVEREAASATEAPLGVDQRQKRKTQQHTALGEGTGGLEGGEQSATQEGSDAAGNGQVDVCNEKTPRKTPRGVMSLEDQQRELRRKLEIALARHLAAQEETEDAPRARFTERGRGQARRPKRAKDAVEEDAQNIVGRAREVAIVGCIEKIGHCRVRAATRGGRPMMISSATIRDVSPSPSGGHPKDAAGGGKDAARIHVTWFDKFVQVVKLKRRHVVCLIGKLVRGKTGRMKMHNPKFQFLAPSEDVFFASAAKDSVSPPDAGPDAEQESTGLLPPADDQTEDERATRSHSVTASMQTGCVSLQPHGCPAGTQNGSREAAVLSPSAEDAGRHSVQTAEAGTEPVHQRTDGVLKGTRSVTEEAPAHNETPSASPPVQKLMPIYPSVAGVPAKIIRAGIDTILRANRLAELVPEYLRRKRGLWTLDRIMRALHYPESSEDIQRAKRDLFYSTMLWLQLAKKMRTREVESQFRGYASRGGEDVLRAFYSSLTFPLTPSQMQAIEEIRGDMASDRPMRRLLQGDVGSGKTVVAAAALLLSAASGHQAALLAPTAALARQHQLSLEKFLGPLGFRVNLLVSDSPDKDATIRLINTGNAEITVGTHALLQNYVLFPRLGLLVVDEQHKFGVNQRWKLLVRRATGEPVAEDLSSSASSQGQKHPRVGSEGTKDECPKPRSSAADPGTVENGAGVRKTMPHGAALASEDVQGARKEAHVSKQGCGENADASADSSKEPKRLQARDCPPEAAGRTETGEGVEGGRIADVLLMTATPIPRTQVLLKYGDLKLSKLLASELRPWQSQHRPSEPEKERGRNLPNRDGEEKPDMLQTTPGSQTEYRRPQVETYLIDKRREAEVGEMMRIIRDEISKKRQVFWVCPLVDGVGVSKRKGMSEKGRRKGTPTPNPCGEATPESLALEFEAHQRGRTNEGELEGTNKDGERRGTCATKRGTQKEHNSKESAAVQRFEELARLLPDVRVRLLHGRMKPEEKEEALSDLREGRVDLLVATTVVEVGIDIPNASVIVIDGAERFGLTQLHQLRGRVGRDARCPSFCFVLIDPLNKNLDEKAMHRFAAMAATTDGFQLAETDAQLRGAGTLFGRQQHGQSDLWIVSGLKRKEHARILETATKDAEEIIGLLEDQTQNSRCSASLEGSAENDPAANRNWFAHSNKAETRDDPRVRNSFVDRAIYGGQLAGEPVLIELGTKTASFDGQLDQRSGMSFIQNVGVTCGYDGPPIDKPKEKQGTKGTSLQSSSVADSSACEEGKAGSPAKEKQTQTASGRNKTCKNVYIGSLDRCSAEGSETRNLKLSLTQEDIKAARELAEEVRVLIPPSKVDWLFRV